MVLESRLAPLSIYLIPRKPRAKDAWLLAMGKRVAGGRKVSYCKGYFVLGEGWRMRGMQYRK